MRKAGADRRWRCRSRLVASGRALPGRPGENEPQAPVWPPSRRRRCGCRAGGPGGSPGGMRRCGRRVGGPSALAEQQAPAWSPIAKLRCGRASCPARLRVPFACRGRGKPPCSSRHGDLHVDVDRAGGGKAPPAPRTGRRCGTSPCWARRSSTTQRRTAREHGRLPPSTGRARSRGGHPLERRAGATCSPPTQPLRACRPAPCPCRRGRARRAPPGSNSPAGSARRSWPGRPAEGAAGPRPLAVAARRTGSTGRGGPAPGSHPTAALILATTISTATRL